MQLERKNMPVFTEQTLHAIGVELFKAAGVPDEQTQMVIDHLVESNLFGHDSHGAIRYPEYVKAIVKEGRFNASATTEVTENSPCTAVVDNGGGLGQVGGTFAIDLAIKKARENGTATVTLRNTSHVGRAGAYPLRAAREGMIAFATVNAGKFGNQIAPFGGIDGKLSTDPIAFAAPRRDAAPIMVDMTTSVVAEGKVRVAANKGVQVPEGWMIDSDGNPTTDPTKLKSDPRGAILPLGGIVAHKGYGLGIMVEILGGALSGQGCAAGENTMESNGVLFTVFNIEHFTPMDQYYDHVETMMTHVKSSRLAPGFSEILAPGEPEFNMAKHRRAHGIEIDDKTWSDIVEAADMVGIDATKWL
jgi:hydroxycarboxylate dehydrogenase B